MNPFRILKSVLQAAPKLFGVYALLMGLRSRKLFWLKLGGVGLLFRFMGQFVRASLGRGSPKLRHRQELTVGESVLISHTSNSSASENS